MFRVRGALLLLLIAMVGGCSSDSDAAPGQGPSVGGSNQTGGSTSTATETLGGATAGGSGVGGNTANPQCIVESGEIPTAADTYIDSGMPETAYGGDDSLYIQKWVEGRLMRVLLRFELAGAVPSGATLLAADILMTGGPLDRAGTVAVHRLLRAWDESSATWNTPATGSSWTTPGGDMDPTPIAAVFLPARSTTPVWDVLLDVQRFQTGELENFGWLLRDNEESSHDTALAFAFDSRSSTNFEDRARLRIRYCFNCDRCL